MADRRRAHTAQEGGDTAGPPRAPCPPPPPALQSGLGGCSGARGVWVRGRERARGGASACQWVGDPATGCGASVPTPCGVSLGKKKRPRSPSVNTARLRAGDPAEIIVNLEQAGKLRSTRCGALSVSRQPTLAVACHRSPQRPGFGLLFGRRTDEVFCSSTPTGSRGLWSLGGFLLKRRVSLYRQGDLRHDGTSQQLCRRGTSWLLPCCTSVQWPTGLWRWGSCAS